MPITDEERAARAQTSMLTKVLSALEDAATAGVDATGALVQFCTEQGLTDTQIQELVESGYPVDMGRVTAALGATEEPESESTDADEETDETDA